MQHFGMFCNPGTAMSKSRFGGIRAEAAKDLQENVRRVEPTRFRVLFRV